MDASRSSPPSPSLTKQKSQKRQTKNEKLNDILQIVFPSTTDASSSNTTPLTLGNLEERLNTISESTEVSPCATPVGPTSSTSTASGSRSGYMKAIFGEKKQKFVPTTPSNNDEGSVLDGRLGMSPEVGLQTHHLDVVPGDNLALIGNNNFQSVKASHCVFKGKWTYEVLLGTSGLMQVGWCMSTCKFNREEGVGDTKNSYAFDGYRESKWNSRVSTKYGAPWEADDVVTCLLDLDKRSASFLLNGKDLGEAFKDIPCGPGFAYFPGLSLAYKEVAFCNFGQRPLKYPVPGFQPLQSRPSSAPQVDYLMQSLRTMFVLPSTHPTLCGQLRNVERNILLAHIMQRAGPLLKCQYNVEAYLLPALMALTPSGGEPGSDDDDSRFRDLHFSLSALWQYADLREARDAVNSVFGSVLRNYRATPVHVNFHQQHRLLTFVYGMLRHRQTRRNLSVHCSFDKHAELPALFHIKQVSKHREAGLSELIPIVWGQGNDPKATYEQGYEKLKDKMNGIKNLQKRIMTLLVIDGSAEQLEVSGAFVKYFRKYLQNITTMTRSEHTMVCPPLVLHSFMQRLLDVVKDLWEQLSDTKSSYVSSSEAYIPTEMFYTDTIDYFDLQRVGGLKNFLFNQHKDDLAKEGVTVVRGRTRRSNDDNNWNDSSFLQIFDDSPSTPATGSSILPRNDDDADLVDSFSPVIRLARALLNQSSKSSSRDRNLTVTRKRSSDDAEETLPCKPSVIELTDGCVLLYNHQVHQHMDKIHSTRSKIVEYATALNDIEIKLRMCVDDEHEDVRKSLNQSHTVLLRHMTELCRSIAWLKASVYSPESQLNLWWLLQLGLRTVHAASDKGALFTFLPEFYLNAGTRLYKCLREYFSPSQPFEKLPQLDTTLMSFVRFLSKFHCDSRVVNNDVKTSLANTITTFITYPLQLRVIESLPAEDLRSFVRNMLYEYDEDKPWTSVGHRILATLWRGSGFAMRYDHPPYVAKVKKLLNREHDPYVPSQLLASIRELLLAEPVLAGKFVHSILEHLNWSFSEFIGQLQEVQQSNSRGWDNSSGLLASLDAQALRQLRIVDMLFELSIALMRVLELTIAVAPDVYLDWNNRDTSETLVTGLVQCLNQILGRVTSKENLFDKVVADKQPGLSSVQHYPLMTSSAGIIIRLLRHHDHPEWTERAMKVIMSDAGFDMRSVQYLLNLRDQDMLPEVQLAGSSHQRGITSPYNPAKDKKFISLSDYEEVTDEEVVELRDVIHRLSRAVDARKGRRESEDMDEDNMCSICYAREVSVEFLPCKHTSCKACIKQHLMSTRECFYCKATIDSYRDLNVDDEDLRRRAL